MPRHIVLNIGCRSRGSIYLAQRSGAPFPRAEGRCTNYVSILSQPTPTLNIRYSATAVTIAWPSQFAGFVLEHSADLSDGKWITLTNPVPVVRGENRVVVAPDIGNHFFRLRSR